MYVDAETITTVARVIEAIILIVGILIAGYKWYEKQNKQDADIKSMKEEQCLLTYGILACLDGLEQLGCNHTVPDTRNKIEKYINNKAHEQEDK